MDDKPIFVWHDSTSRATQLAVDATFAAEQVRRAALRGGAAAQLSWGFLLLDGHGTSRDLSSALKWFQLAARSGNRDAINMVGRCHELGWGTEINPSLAVHCYRAAAESGHAWAQFNLACLILRDDSVRGELAEALSLLVRSARQGNVKAMSMLGRCREEGWRGSSKPASARRWYLRAARGGCFRGAFHTARHLIAAGEIDPAMKWLRRSIAAAPADFCRELSATFAIHTDERLRAISPLALSQAHRAAEHPPGSERAPAIPVARLPVPLRRRRSMRSVGTVMKRLAASVGILRQ